MTTDNTVDIRLTDTGIRLTAPDNHDDLRAAGTAAILLAEEVEARYGDGADLARMLRTANAFAQDVIRFDNANAHESHDETDPDAWSSGQWADVLVLGMAVSWSYRVHARPENNGGPSGTDDASEFMVDVWNSLFRQAGIQSLRGNVDQIDYRYGKHHE